MKDNELKNVTGGRLLDTADNIIDRLIIEANRNKWSKETVLRAINDIWHSSKGSDNPYWYVSSNLSEQDYQEFIDRFITAWDSQK